MEVAGEGVDVLREAHQFPAHALKLAMGVRQRVELRLELRGVDGQDRQPLRPVVVHLPGDPAALILLRLEEPSGQQPEFVLGLSKRFLTGVHVLIRPLPGQSVGEDLADGPEA